MKFKGIKKVHEGRFITSYNAEYETEAGNQKIYEMSREIKILRAWKNSSATSVTQ